MLQVRQSPDTEDNKAFAKDKEDRSNETNSEWIRRWRADKPSFCRPNDVILLGGKSLTDFRVRVAQSHARHDMTPSYWSLAGVVSGPDRFLTAPLWPLVDPSRIPLSNGIRSLALSSFDDQKLWPNIGIISFPGLRRSPVRNIGKLRTRRSVIDIPSLLLPWLGFAWGAGTAGNPLLQGYGVPSAVLVEAAFGMAEVELTPGLAAASSCPEAIYQAARWWTGFYQDTAGYEEAAGSRPRGSADEVPHPVGRFVLREPQASYVEPE